MALAHWKARLHEIMEAPVVSDPVSYWYKVFSVSLISASVLSVVLETVPALFGQYGAFFAIFECISVAIFTVEYVLHVAIADTDPRYQRPFWGRLKFLVSPLALVDLVAVLPFYLPMVTPVDLRFMRVLRLLRLMRIFKIGRYSESMEVMGAVIHSKKEELLVTTAVALMMLTVVSSLMYYLENAAQPQIFSSIPAAMWWGVATLTTVGYGDIYPITPLGKLLGGFSALMGIGMFALPAGILGSAFVVEMQKRHSAPKTCSQCGKVVD
jgi:voltage-gated potassium channel